MVSFMALSSLSHFQSEILYPIGIRGCGLFRDQRKKARKSPSQEDCGIPQAKRGYAAKASLLGLWIDFIIYAGTTEPLL